MTSPTQGEHAQPELSYEQQRAIMEGERNDSLDAYSRVVYLTTAESRLYESAFTNGWDRHAAQVAAITASPVAQGAAIAAGAVYAELPEAVIDAVAAALGDARDCVKVWSAWSYNTMHSDDFSMVAEDGERVAEIASAAIGAYLASHGQAPAPTHEQIAAYLEATGAYVTNDATREAAIAEAIDVDRAKRGQAPAQPDAPLPLLVRDIAAELGITAPQACKSLFAAGCGETSVNMAVTPRMARALRAMHPAPSPQAAQQAPKSDRAAIELMGVAEAIEEGGGFWRSCTGCHELNEGHSTGPHSLIFKCALGLGCGECGGIGAIWDTTDYNAMADAMAKADTAAHAQQAPAGAPKRILEPGEGLVHYASPPGSDSVTACGISDWIGEPDSTPTTRKVTCKSCQRLAAIFAPAPAAPSTPASGGWMPTLEQVLSAARNWGEVEPYLCRSGSGDQKYCIVFNVHELATHFAKELLASPTIEGESK